MNVVLTFADEREWPRDRGKRPPRTHEFQLLVVHLGCTGEAGVGLPQFSIGATSRDLSRVGPRRPGAHGHGRLARSLRLDRRRRQVRGAGQPTIFFRCVLKSPTRLAVGIKFDASHGWNMREIDCSEFGRITGVWEIGPIISGDRWIPDVLCRNLPQVKGPHPLCSAPGTRNITVKQ